MVDVKDLSCVEMTEPEEKVCFLVFLYHISQAIEGCRLTWAFCASMSERLLRVLAQHVSRYASMGTPCLLRGDRRSDGFFWLLFLAAEKK